MARQKAEATERITADDGNILRQNRSMCEREMCVTADKT